VRSLLKPIPSLRSASYVLQAIMTPWLLGPGQLFRPTFPKYLLINSKKITDAKKAKTAIGRHRHRRSLRAAPAAFPSKRLKAASADRLNGLRAGSDLDCKHHRAFARRRRRAATRSRTCVAQTSEGSLCAGLIHSSPIKGTKLTSAMSPNAGRSRKVMADYGHNATSSTIRISRGRCD
jgi:hypothetical protein